jgi:hypothetical protein
MKCLRGWWVAEEDRLVLANGLFLVAFAFLGRSTHRRYRSWRTIDMESSVQSDGMTQDTKTCSAARTVYCLMYA